MLKKLCKCGKVIPITQKQCDDCKNKYQKNYDKYKRTNHDIYTSKAWSSIRTQCKSRVHGVDLYHYHKTGKIVAGTLAHHIVEVSEDISKVYDIDNLFWLSDKSHKAIHALYSRDTDTKISTQALLLDLNKKVCGGGLKCFR